MRIERGAVVSARLDPAVGHEQRGIRPCVVVSDPDVSADQRFPLLCVVPVTGTPGQGPLYPRIEVGQSGLRRTSYALVDQIRALDKRRLGGVFGRIQIGEMNAIEDGIRLFLSI